MSRRAGVLAVLPFAVVLAALALPVPVRTQERSEGLRVDQLDREYRAAASACEAAVKAREVDQPEYDRLLGQAQAASRSGDREAWEEAQSRLLELSQILDSRQRRVTERCGDAEELRQELLDGLDARRRTLEERLGAAESSEARLDVQALLIDVHNRYRELEEEGGGLALQLVMRPLIDIDRRDTPDRVRQKAEFLERQIEEADSLLVTIDVEIERLESRIRGMQQRENFQRNLRRFDQTRSPVGSNPREGEANEQVAADSTTLGELSLEKRLEATRAARRQLEFYRDQMAERVREFRDYLRRIT